RSVERSTALCGCERREPPSPDSPKLDRPLLLVPRHLPKHPFIPRTDDKRFFHSSPFFGTSRRCPLIDLLPHPLLDFSKLRGSIEHQPVAIRVVLGWRPFLQQMVSDDAVDPVAGEGDHRDLSGGS